MISKYLHIYDNFRNDITILMLYYVAVRIRRKNLTLYLKIFKVSLFLEMDPLHLSVYCSLQYKYNTYKL